MNSDLKQDLKQTSHYKKRIQKPKVRYKIQIMSGQPSYNYVSKRSPRRSPTKQVVNNQQLKHPLLQRNRTQSDISYQGNTIDMVRIVRKNEQSRLSLINIDHGQYMKYNKQDNNQIWRFSQNDNRVQNNKQKQDEIIQSTMVHMGTLSPQQKNLKYIQHYVRPSNVNILKHASEQSNNKVMGITLMILFLVLYNIQVIANIYYLNACHIIISGYGDILVYSSQFYQQLFKQIQKYNFLYVLVLYLIIQCIYHLIIFGINSKTNNKYKLIDNQIARLSYILRNRNNDNNDQGKLLKITKSPKFTILIVILATMLYQYGIVNCYYYNEINQVFVYQMSSAIIKFIQIFYFALILPQAIKYLLLQKINNTNYKNKQNNQHKSNSLKQFNDEQSDRWKLSRLTTIIGVDNWWIKLSLVVLGLSFIYSLITSIFLIVISLSKIQLNYIRLKYKIDTFYIQLIGKCILLGISILILMNRQQLISFLTFDYSLQCIILITISFLLTRVLSNIFIRQQLYKYLFSQMHINVFNMIYIFVIVYIIVSWIGELYYITTNFIFIAVYSILLAVAIYQQNQHRQIVQFDQEYGKHSQIYMEMGTF